MLIHVNINSRHPFIRGFREVPLFVSYFYVNIAIGLKRSVVGLTPVNVRLYVITDVSFDIWMLSFIMTSFTSSVVEVVNLLLVGGCLDVIFVRCCQKCC